MERLAWGDCTPRRHLPASSTLRVPEVGRCLVADMLRFPSGLGIKLISRLAWTNGPHAGGVQVDPGGRASRMMGPIATSLLGFSSGTGHGFPLGGSGDDFQGVLGQQVSLSVQFTGRPGDSADIFVVAGVAFLQ